MLKQSGCAQVLFYETFQGSIRPLMSLLFSIEGNEAQIISVLSINVAKSSLLFTQRPPCNNYKLMNPESMSNYKKPVGSAHGQLPQVAIDL